MLTLSEPSNLPISYQLTVPTFDEEKLLIYRELYYDGFSSIIAARDLTTGTAVAVKKIDFKYLKSSKLSVKLLRQRFSRKIRQNTSKIRSLSNSSILKLIEFVIEPKRFIIVTEMCMFGDLFNWILQQQQLRIRDICLLIQYIFQALRYLHNQNYVHGNLTPTHILFQTMSPQSVTLMLDLSIRNELLYITGKPSSVIYGWAPELIRSVIQLEKDNELFDKMPEENNVIIEKTPQMDIWSAGVIAYIALTGKPPYQANELLELLKLIDRKEKTTRYSLVQTFHPIIVDKLNQLLNPNINERTLNEQTNEIHWFADNEDIKKDERNLLRITEYDMMSTCRQYRLQGRRTFEKFFR